MITQFLFLFLGFVVLVGGAEILVKGSTAIAQSFGVSSLMIGLTVVAFGTSAPELFVSLQAAFDGTPDVAVGNVVGSNIFNILVIVGLAAAIKPITIAPAVVQREMPIMLCTVLLFMVLGLDGVLGRIDGLIMVLGIVAYLVMNYILVKRRPVAQLAVSELADDSQHATTESASPLPLSIFFVCAGLGSMIFGAGWIVENAVSLATAFQIHPLVIGITVVAVGTSLPEVAATFAAARKSQSDLAIGNAIGSNIFNVLCVLGFTSLVHPIALSQQVRSFDNFLMLGFCILAYVFMRLGMRITRAQGIGLIVIYFVYTFYLFL